MVNDILLVKNLNLAMQTKVKVDSRDVFPGRYIDFNCPQCNTKCKLYKSKVNKKIQFVCKQCGAIYIE